MARELESAGIGNPYMHYDQCFEEYGRKSTGTREVFTSNRDPTNIIGRIQIAKKIVSNALQAIQTEIKDQLYLSTLQ